MLLGMRSALLGSVPALYLPFALTGTLDSRVTFSRGTHATMYDSTGKLVYAPNNLLTFSQDFTNAAWASSNTPIRTSGQIDPAGGTTATKLDLDVNDGIFQFLGSRVGNFIFSIWVRGDSAGTTRLSDASSGAFDISVNVTTAWTRVNTGSRAISGLFSPYLYRGAGDLATVYVAFSQLEQVTYQTTPSTYNATTSAAYYGPRFDYNPATLVARGLLIEEARTNTITSSQNFSGTGWFVDGAVLTPNAGVAPDGTNTATSIVTGTGNNRVYQFDNSGVTGNKVASFYVKSNAGSSISIGATGAMSPPGPAVVNTATGTVTGFSGASVVPVRDGWFRVFLPVSVTTASGNSTYWVISGPASSVFIWGFQLEAGSFATSYIPTAASAVARSADSATMTGTNFSSWYNQTQGTFVANSECGGISTAAFVAQAGVVGSGDYIDVLRLQPTTKYLVVDNSVQQVAIDLGVTPAAGVFNKSAVTYRVNDFAAAINGGAVLTDSVGDVPTPDRFFIGNSDGAYFLNGHIASIAYYNTRLPNATLQSLTLPVIADYYFLVTAGGDQLTDASDNPLYTQPLYL